MSAVKKIFKYYMATETRRRNGVRRSICGAVAFAGLVLLGRAANAQQEKLAIGIEQTLALPVLSPGEPAAGKIVSVTPPEYAGTKVFHTVYLPKDWRPAGPALPIIFEYTGNYYPASGSTGKVEDAALGYGLSGGKYIWVSLPYVNKQHSENEVTWWGDEEATVAYAKQNVPRIIKQFAADSKAVFLCGFSRGAIGVNYIGLHDEEIAGLWSAFFTHDHFDGVREWNTHWGSPLEEYRRAAKERLQLVGGRPYWVSQNGSNHAAEDFVRESVADAENFRFAYIDCGRILGLQHRSIAAADHTDRWPLVPSEDRERVRKWMKVIVSGGK